jgi:predicted dehydrogenase
MRFLIVGNSSIVARRALPALLQLPGVQSVDIASRRPLQHSSLPENWNGRIYDDYREAITDSQADVVYVSLINSLHEEWVETALRSGKHVVVDKPAFLSLAAADRLIELADKKGLCLAEAVVFSYHPQFMALQRLLLEHGESTRLTTTFTFPPLADDNFRNHAKLGGGSLYDLGPYAAAVSRIFFGEFPEEIMCRVVSYHPASNVDTAFSLLACYSGGRSYVGHFGFDTEYQNGLTLIGPEIAVTVARIFTTPPDMQIQLDVSRHNGQSRIPVEAGDSFKLFFAGVIEAVEKHSWSKLADDLRHDAQVLDAMRASALRKSR